MGNGFEVSMVVGFKTSGAMGNGVRGVCLVAHSMGFDGGLSASELGTVGAIYIYILI
jgi:hypothetical protein